MIPRLELASAVLAGALLGLLAGAAGSFVIRVGGTFPWGLAIAVLAVAATAAFCRALGGWRSFLPLALAVAAGIALTAFYSPGGDQILPGDALTLAWILGAAAAVIVVALLPRRWFESAPTL